MKLTIKITMENDSFADGNAGPETARILRDVADRLENRNLDGGCRFPLSDNNGNKVGEVKTTP